jgi:hypothetical protein
MEIVFFFQWNYVNLFSFEYVVKIYLIWCCLKNRVWNSLYEKTIVSKLIVKNG